MKKLATLFLALLMVVVLAGCGTNNEKATSSDSNVDIDLTKLSSTMVYSEVYNMTNSPESYLGKIVKMKGNFAMYYDEMSQQYYFACITTDAASCCQQYLEFVLAGEHQYPNDYPALDAEITVIGEFQTYMEGDNRYCTLLNASLQ